MPEEPGILPPGFAAQLLSTVEPGEVEGVAAVVTEAVTLDDARLAALLRMVARRLASSPEPLRARELASFLNSARTA
ncbi:MAG: hypothetical protein ACREPI_04430 [Candidatus Dormibacterales bacterium]